jgi:hypothetical protein
MAEWSMAVVLIVLSLRRGSDMHARATLLCLACGVAAAPATARADVRPPYTETVWMNAGVTFRFTEQAISPFVPVGLLVIGAAYLIGFRNLTSRPEAPR